MIRNALAATAIAASLIIPAGAADLTTREIENGFKRHATLTQLHRWYLLYEEPTYGIANQLDILDPYVRVVSGLGEANGHEEYAERLNQIPTTWKNAHDVKSTEVTIADDGGVSLTANITYLNQGLLPDGKVRSADLTYTTKLTPADGVLPKFTAIKIAQNSEGTAEAFESQYGNNRMRALVHYWLALIEDPSRDAEPVREILADDFVLDFSSGAISDFDGFKTWLAGPGSAVRASTHKIEGFAQRKLDDGTYEVVMKFDWNGILPNDTEMLARTRHTWIVEDDPTARFARIKRMGVEVLEPFRPKEG
ncbi:hypothetical protein [Ahrensia sp. R2A130]|uniref:hypothetical protein n=1 Tax=Ahrensia sp. R2A130 TaxID=744979 RepID=UPI0001E09CC1|nr:hypothetical protein [Ahrensia sp. R2A130]EFL88217.1 hypothetical protein R2A130_2036 [Ahrensia sp. R2A130]